ncbi:TetR/AcrR family transcriptional regulator [Pseudomonas sp. NFX224]|uniref:TetR/AcrR family transcriptional regulator n=1 Tax=Pseudomonas sp. NFX224 TaxID=3402862 RepID=UPI003AFA9390
MPTIKPRSRGRPRAADVEERIFDATLRIFGSRGWSGLSIEAVATEAKVGKASIYLRWSEKLQLLIDAIHDYHHRCGSVNSPDAEGGSVRERLIHSVEGRARLLLGAHGLAVVRLQVEIKADPETWRPYREAVMRDSVLRARHWLQDAIDRGEVISQGSAMQILEAIEGSVYVHVMVTPPELREQVLAALSGWATRLVDTQLGLAGTKAD